ncbi:hypothetical protein AMTRI_Chr12g267010 [Amborella trichopoda]
MRTLSHNSLSLLHLPNPFHPSLSNRPLIEKCISFKKTERRNQLSSSKLILRRSTILRASSRPGSALESQLLSQNGANGVSKTTPEPSESKTIEPQFESEDGEEVELELLEKPTAMAPSSDSEETHVSEPLKPEKVLAPFLRFFKPRDSTEEPQEMDESEQVKREKEKDSKMVKVEYYDPKAGDLVVGVVLSGNENKLDVSIGADRLGTMLTKEILPFYDDEMAHLLCDLSEKKGKEVLGPGKIGIIREEEAIREVEKREGRPVVEPGTVIFAEVLGRTLSGRPLLSTRRLARRIAWHRVRQVKRMNEPIEVRISEWNTGGLLSRIEGLRAFLPKAELIKKAHNFVDLKENVGRRISVIISRIDEDNNDLIISEREAWDMMYLQEGKLLDGTVRKIFSYGAQIRLGESNRSGLLHISNISRARVPSVDDLLAVDEKVKILVVKSMFPGNISLSIADLESEPGLFLSNKERVFSEAEGMAKKYRAKLPFSMTRKLETTQTESSVPFDDEANLYANWVWFEFQQMKDP